MDNLRGGVCVVCECVCVCVYTWRLVSFASLMLLLAVSEISLEVEYVLYHNS